ncbi:ABC1 kinase family protein [Granulicoccus phenolivorans]|uniref:ABC1 kinase family protein n=1 Tax=Granulicoccus phenolivorans TaxID=266854 RepID=UPI00041D7514|nr:AarF/ABC1/UbiB kinase family protein [Granulicoccus phenolivorans]
MQPEDGDSAELRRSSLGRGARLMSLPFGAAGRATRGVGRRLGGQSADAVTAQARHEAAEQLFRVLGDLKGGAMKVGQMLSLFEVALPEDMAEPYRLQLRKLQDSAPPMPATRVDAVLTTELGPQWRSLFSEFRSRPTAAASIGQVHKGVWAADGRKVAIKIQYPGADKALESDLKMMKRLGSVLQPLAGGIEVRPLIDEMAARINEESDYTLEAAAQQQAAEALEGHPEFTVPRVLTHTGKVMVSEWVDGERFSDAPTWTEERRNQLGLRYVRFLFAMPSLAGLLHGDPHPGNFKVLPDGRLAALDWGLASRMPDGLPPAMGRLMRHAADGNAAAMTAGLRSEGFLTAEKIDPQDLLDYLEPFVEPALVETFHFHRAWMRDQFQRVNAAAATPVVRHLNLPPEYGMVWKVWIGGIAVLSQIDVRAGFGAVLDEFLPLWRR